MHFLTVGLDHRTAPVDVRERLHWTDATEQLAALRALAAGPVSEAVLLCTCNRTDVVAVAGDPGPAAAHLTAVLAARAGWEPERLRRYLYTHVGTAATAAHLCRVSCGLESLVLGETQVLSQVREAYLRAGEAGTVGKRMHGLFHHALACSRRVHAETALAAAPVSVGAAAVEFARRALGALEGRRALVLGAGETAETVARRLGEAGVGRLLVCNRTPERAEDLAARVGGEAVPFASLERVLVEADVVVASTASPEPVITPAWIDPALAARGGRPLLILDIAVPRDVDPAVAGPSVRLHNIDDLEAVAAEGRGARAREARRAEALIAQEVEGLEAWLRALDVVPVIRALRARFETVAEAETRRTLRRLAHLSARDQALVRQMGSAIVNKLLNGPIERIRDLAGEPAGQHAVRALAEAFQLDLPPVAGLPAADGAAPSGAVGRGTAPPGRVPPVEGVRAADGARGL